MKRYDTPQLTVYGNIGAITQALFNKAAKADKVFIGGSNVTGPISSVGSDDGIIVPK